MKLELRVDKRTLEKLRALASDLGCEASELAGEAVRALVRTAPQRRPRRSAATSAPLRSDVRAAVNPIGGECLE